MHAADSFAKKASQTQLRMLPHTLSVLPHTLKNRQRARQALHTAATHVLSQSWHAGVCNRGGERETERDRERQRERYRKRPSRPRKGGRALLLLYYCFTPFLNRALIEPLLSQGGRAPLRPHPTFNQLLINSCIYIGFMPPL